MSISILPARLANQIAAGEVVERPASVIKELVENSLDAGATNISIDIEKGGAKRIRIKDNGCGIIKEELTLALSRHATSKIKNLDDLEAISSLGFRGEALASISSVARLTLTSKPANQETAWQAHAEGREMHVVVQPAAHPNGTTIDVTDLFFNTPARRKFLRTEKTEFAHIEEVIKRIALARFDVSFILSHNNKIVKNYRAVTKPEQNLKRVAAVCGQNFVDHAIEVNCKHDDIHLSGWLAKPSFLRKQNDLCYSYVNGRMMRDKLINHAIRQAYSEFIDLESYPAFVLFLNVDFKEVDVNVHPAKHEVRFHQSRYVHDFIYSVCHKALVGELTLSENIETLQDQSINQQYQQHQQFIQPLQHVSEKPTASYQEASRRQHNMHTTYQANPNSATKANKLYQDLMTPAPQNTATKSKCSAPKLLHVNEEKYGLFQLHEQLYLCDLFKLQQLSLHKKLSLDWPQGLTRQPLLLPVKITINSEQKSMLEQQLRLLEQSGITLQFQHGFIQIREFPALLREKDVSACFNKILDALPHLSDEPSQLETHWHALLVNLSCTESIHLNEAIQLWQQLSHQLAENFTHELLLKSTPVDLTSFIKQLT